MTAIVLPAAVAFAGLAALGCRLGKAACEGITPFEDGPIPGKPPVRALIAAGAFLGAAIVAHGIDGVELAIAALMTLVLSAGWVSDVLCGILPDLFTLLPLVVVAAIRIGSHEAAFMLTGLAVALPFALAAIASKGLGMGWGDVKLAALGGVALGPSSAVGSFLLASIIAMLGNLRLERRKQPFAFGPYLASAIGVALATGVRG